MDREQLRASLMRTAGNGYLLFPAGGQDEFWKRVGASAAYNPYVDEIRAEGARLLQEPIVEPTYSQFMLFERQGNRLEFERVYFEKRRRLNTMAFLALLEPEQAAYRAALEDILWAVCNEYSWCLPAHLKHSTETDGSQSFVVDSADWSRRGRRTNIDLFAAETGFALSEIVRLTEAWLSPLVRSRVEEEIVGRIFKPYLQHGPYHWETAEHNWAAVCAGSIASTALHLLGDTEQLAAIVDKALASMDCYLSGFGEDGACLEGVGYWNYGFGFFAYFADLLQRRTQGEIDLFRSEKVHRIALFQQKAYLDGDMTVNFSDSQQRSHVQIGLTHYLAKRYDDVAVPPSELRAPYTEDHCSRWAHAFRNLLWFDPSQGGAAWEAGDYYLEDAQWLVSRHATSSGRYGFAAKGGHNAEPHNHNDVGQFILTAGGEAFLADLGSGEYTDRYFGPERYTYDCNGSQGHSVPIVDGHVQAEGVESAARGVQASLGDDEDRFRLDLAAAYRLPQLSSLVRTFTWRKTETPQLVLEDSYEFTSAPTSIVERFVTALEPCLDEAGAALTIAAEGYRGTLVVRYDAADVRPTVIRHTFKDHFGRDAVWYAVDFAVLHPQPKHRVELSFQFMKEG